MAGCGSSAELAEALLDGLAGSPAPRWALRRKRQPSGDGERLVTVRGKIRNLRTGRETSFRLWLEADSFIVPVRFEFQPRSFLRLTFEAAKSDLRLQGA